MGKENARVCTIVIVYACGDNARMGLGQREMELPLAHRMVSDLSAEARLSSSSKSLE